MKIYPKTALVKAALDKAQQINPRYVPDVTDELIAGWADMINIHVPTGVWEDAINIWASSSQPRHLTAGILKQSLYAAVDKWETNPHKRGELEQFRNERERQRNIHQTGSPDGRRPIDELGPPPGAGQLEVTKNRFSVLSKHVR